MGIGLWKNRKADRSITNIVDVHSHILPCLDDGSKSLEQSMEMVRIADEEGISAIIATPHVMPDRRSFGRERTEEAVARLQEEIAAAGYGVALYPGSEIYFHEEALKGLESGRLLTLAGSECVLVEFSPMSDARYIRNALGEILSLGLTPVLAHVERYESLMRQAREQVSALKGMGALIQTNASAIDGSFGKPVQRQILLLLKEQLIDFVGTDAHGTRSRAPKMSECVKVLCRRCPAQYAAELLGGNAGRYLFS